MEKADIKVYEFEHFKNRDSIVHGIFTRAGGIRKMNLNPLIFLNQVHGSDIKVLKKEDNDLSENFQPGAYTADGIVTDMKDVSLVIQVADCQAVMLYDPEKKVIANVHSGWRGSVQNIIGKCVDKMILEFGCQPGNIMAGISPSLGPCCSEFVNYKNEIPKTLWNYKINGKDYFNFWEMTKGQLMDNGVKKEHIENMEICTKCNTDIFYSFRGEKTTGRFACVISMT
ncbi:MAG: peptidoglycan editing factor PgeF [Desulfobacterales bacterium]|nr:peptidoglycan editing factor PgeF [Desulfobacterales bacterium]